MGPRRAGKSVSVKRTIARLIREEVDPLAITFCPCETLNQQDLRRIVKLAGDLTPRIENERRYWFFDEVTFVSNWAATLKQLRDNTILRDGCVVATGSSTANLREARGDLGGRESGGETRLLLPMGFRPFVRELYPELYEDLPTQTFGLSDLQSEAARRYLESMNVLVDDVALAWERHLGIGGFPRAVADAVEGVDVAESTTRSLWNILAGDVLHVGSMRDRDVKALLRRLVNAVGSPISVSNIAEELSIGARNTVKDRIDRICASLYAWRAPVTHDGTNAVKGGQDKLYFIDPLIARLPSLRDNAIAQPEISYLSEQQLGTCLMKAVAHENPAAVLDEAAVLVRRNPDSGAEIDFVGRFVTVPIEGKYVSKGWKPERQALQEHYGDGIVATREILDTSGDIWAVPSGLVAWMMETTP
jgi:predicted AAA+ superfamily ATPase